MWQRLDKIRQYQRHLLTCTPREQPENQPVKWAKSKNSLKWCEWYLLGEGVGPIFPRRWTNRFAPSSGGRREHLWWCWRISGPRGRWRPRWNSSYSLPGQVRGSGPVLFMFTLEAHKLTPCFHSILLHLFLRWSTYLSYSRVEQTLFLRITYVPMYVLLKVPHQLALLHWLLVVDHLHHLNIRHSVLKTNMKRI